MTAKAARGRVKRGPGQLPIWDSPSEEASALPEDPVKKRLSRRQLATCNPDMLRWARSSGGFSVEFAAKGLGITEARLIAWESGGARPTIPQLRNLARLYKRPLASFYLSARPTDFTLPKDYRRLPGDPPAAYSPALLFGLRTASYRRAVALELETEAVSMPLFATRQPGESAEDVAKRARTRLGIRLDEQRSWTGKYDALNGWKNAAERLGVLVFHFGDVPVDEARGFSLVDPVLPVIALNGSDSVNGRVFTLAHELGHLVAGGGGTCDLVFRAASTGVDAAEVYANRFAGALLVPQEAILADVDVSRANKRTEWSDAQLERLARMFRVSREVVLRRLLILERTDEAIYQARRAELLALPRPELSVRPGRPAVAVMALRDVGKPFARLVLDAYHAASITGTDVSDYLGVRLKHLAKIEERLAGPDMLTGGEP